MSFPQKVDTLTLKCVNFVNFVNFWKEKSHRFAMGFTYLSAAEFIRLFGGPRKSLIFGERPPGAPKSSARMGRAEA